MGGYAFYVWSAWAICVLVLAANCVFIALINAKAVRLVHARHQK